MVRFELYIYHGSGKVETSETDAVEELAFQCEIPVASLVAS